jgi:hypothetical protein
MNMHHDSALSEEDKDILKWTAGTLYGGAFSRFLMLLVTE